MRHAGPFAYTVFANIVEHVPTGDEHRQNRAQRDTRNALMHMIPALGDMGDEHAANAKQRRD